MQIKNNYQFERFWKISRKTIDRQLKNFLKQYRVQVDIDNGRDCTEQTSAKTSE